MPHGDRTGSEGTGPMTGRAAGFCAGNEEAGFATAPGFFARHPRGGWRVGEGPYTGRGFGVGASFGRRGGGRGLGPGRGYGPGCGIGPGYGRGFRCAPGADGRREAMEAELDALERRAEFVRREMESLDTRTDGEA